MQVVFDLVILVFLCSKYLYHHYFAEKLISNTQSTEILPKKKSAKFNVLFKFNKILIDSHATVRKRSNIQATEVLLKKKSTKFNALFKSKNTNENRKLEFQI